MIITAVMQNQIFFYSNLIHHSLISRTSYRLAQLIIVIDYIDSCFPHSKTIENLYIICLTIYCTFLSMDDHCFKNNYCTGTLFMSVTTKLSSLSEINLVLCYISMLFILFFLPLLI